MLVMRTNAWPRKSQRRVLPVGEAPSANAVPRSWRAPTNRPWSTSVVRWLGWPSSSKWMDPHAPGIEPSSTRLRDSGAIVWPRSGWRYDLFRTNWSASAPCPNDSWANVPVVPGSRTTFISPVGGAFDDRSARAWSETARTFASVTGARVSWPPKAPVMRASNSERPFSIATATTPACTRSRRW